MIKEHISNRDVIGLLEFRHRVFDAAVPGIAVDDDGNEYHYNENAVPLQDQDWHPADDLSAKLVGSLLKKQAARRKASKTKPA